MEDDHGTGGSSSAVPIPGASSHTSPTSAAPLTALQTALSHSPHSPSDDELSSPRHHIRTGRVVEASNIPPRELTWKCCGEEGRGLQLADEAVARSWDDEQAVDAVDSETVRVERADGSPPRSPNGTLIRRRRSLYGDPDSPD
ncbi:hypothetical protein JCM6882_007649 [Rhodosporidiobolus microsporus]